MFSKAERLSTRCGASSRCKSSKEIYENLFHFSSCIIKPKRVWVIGMIKGRECVIRVSLERPAL